MPKSRAITRANKKKGFPPEEPMSIRNDAGYYDPTPYIPPYRERMNAIYSSATLAPALFLLLKVRYIDGI